MDETALESYTTPIDDESTDNPIDEFVSFQQVMTSKPSLNRCEFQFLTTGLLCPFPVMSTQDKGYYSLLVNGLTAEEQQSLQSLLVLAEQKKAQIQSKQIERQGGKYGTKYFVIRSMGVAQIFGMGCKVSPCGALEEYYWYGEQPL